jgi:hypothetical protein
MTAARRLAAILAADVVGYSRLMGEDEGGTMRAQRDAAPIGILRARVIGSARPINRGAIETWLQSLET